MLQTNDTYNPLLQGNPDELADRLIALMPKSEPMTPEQQAKFDDECRAGAACYKEARYGILPADTFRLLEQGGFAGWHYELEIEGEAVVLCDPGEPFSQYEVFANKKRATEIARAEIARRHGQDVADRATFRVVWGGSL